MNKQQKKVKNVTKIDVFLRLRYFLKYSFVKYKITCTHEYKNYFNLQNF